MLTGSTIGLVCVCLIVCNQYLDLFVTANALQQNTTVHSRSAVFPREQQSSVLKTRNKTCRAKPMLPSALFCSEDSVSDNTAE